jgi:hypothetical protein
MPLRRQAVTAGDLLAAAQKESESRAEGRGPDKAGVIVVRPGRMERRHDAAGWSHDCLSAAAAVGQISAARRTRTTCVSLLESMLVQAGQDHQGGDGQRNNEGK